MTKEAPENYDEEFLKANYLAEAGRYQDAVLVFEDLLNKPLNPFVKTVVWVNIAVLKLQANMREEALSAYDQAIDLEKSYDGYFALDSKGCCLANMGRKDEACGIFEEILKRTDLKDEDRDRIESNQRTLLNQKDT